MFFGINNTGHWTTRCYTGFAIAWLIVCARVPSFHGWQVFAHSVFQTLISPPIEPNKLNQNFQIFLVYPCTIYSSQKICVAFFWSFDL